MFVYLTALFSSRILVAGRDGMSRLSPVPSRLLVTTDERSGQVNEIDSISLKTPTLPQEVFSWGPPHCPPERRRPSQAREETARVEQAEQDHQVTLHKTNQTIIGRDLPVTITSQSTNVIQTCLVQRGVITLGVTSHVRVTTAGRLTLFLKNWSMVTQDQWVLNTIQGYRLELLREPVQTIRPRGVKVSTSEQSLIDEEIQKMLQKGAIT